MSGTWRSARRKCAVKHNASGGSVRDRMDMLSTLFLGFLA